MSNDELEDFKLDEIKGFVKRKYFEKLSFDLENPKDFLLSVQSGEAPLEVTIKKIKDFPSILNINYKGLNFLHYVVLNNNFFYVKSLLDASIQAGLTTLPLTGQVVSSTKYAPNQEFLDFIITQNCEESYLATTLMLKSISKNHVEKVLVHSAYKGESKWIKLFRNIYGAEKIDDYITKYFYNNHLHVIEPLKKYEDIKKLKTNVGIDVFKEIDGSNILTKMMLDKSLPIALKTLGYLKNDKTKFGKNYYTVYQDFLINLVENENLNVLVKMPNDSLNNQNYKNLGELLMKELESNVNIENVIDIFNKRLMKAEGNIINPTLKKSRGIKF